MDDPNTNRRNNNRRNFNSRNFNNFPADYNEFKIPKLRWSTNFASNNLIEWKRSMSQYAMHKYKELAFIFDNDEYHEFPDIEIPLDEEGHPLTH